MKYKNSLNKNPLNKNPFFVISQILEKTGLGKEDDDGIIEYFSATAIILNLAEKLNDKTISENDFLLSLKFLNTTDENCKDILNKIKEKVFPLFKQDKLNNLAEVKIEKKEYIITAPKIIENNKKNINSNINSNDAYRESIE